MKAEVKVNIAVQKTGFGIRLVHCGIEDKKDHELLKKKIDRYSISYLTKGKGYYTANGKTYTLNEGDIYVIFQNVEYSQRTDADNPYNYYYVSFLGSDSQDILAHAGFSVDNPVIHLDKTVGSKVLKNMKAIYKNLGKNSFLSISKSVVELLDLFCTLFALKEENTEIQDEEEYYVNAVKTHIENNVSENLKVEEIARKYRIDRTYLSHIFTKAEGKSIKDYIESCKMEKAMNLLREGKMSISKISYLSGYTNLTTFYRQFKKSVGISPSYYKKENLKSVIENKDKKRKENKKDK